MHSLYATAVNLLCRSAVRHPLSWLVILVLLSLPAIHQLGNIRVDTNLIRLLPDTSRASALTRELEDVVSDGGFFTLLMEGDQREVLLEAVSTASRQAGALEGVESAEYTWPVDFIEKYRYLLIPNDYLDRIYGELIRWEAEASPFIDSLEAGEEEEETFADREDKDDLSRSLSLYAKLNRYHESEDGRVMGVFIRTTKGVTSFGDIEEIFRRLSGIAEGLEERYGIQAGVGGSHRNKLDDYRMIHKDLNRAGVIASILIVLLLFASFRSFPVIVVVLVPLLVGLLWAFALVPSTVGDFNLITSFLLVILLGMGVDYSIHLVKRFQRELERRTPEEALVETYLSTGSSVVISGITTALALSILAASDFRGFSEFGIIGALSIVMVLLAMFLVLPVMLTAGRKWGLVGPAADRHRLVMFSGKKAVVVLLAFCVLAAGASYRWLSFDYNLANFEFDESRIAGLRQVKEWQGRVYSGSLSPGALYLAENISSVDHMAGLLREAGRKEETKIGRIRSLRDFSPPDSDLEERITLLEEIQELVEGKWTSRIEDPDKKSLIEDFRGWEIPAAAPGIDTIPKIIRQNYQAKDGSGRHLITVQPAAERKLGQNAMDFTGELYDIENPPGVLGPVGETVVFAEIIWIVIAEGPWLTWLTFGGIFLVVLVYRRALKDTLWILLPLVGGVVMGLGALVATGMKLNFFNLVVLPALLGMGVDGGVHYYRRWRVLKEDTAATQEELFDPLSVANWTTMVGYAGMMFAHHPGIRSIGIFACLGLFCVWLSTLFLMPGLLDWTTRRRGT